MKFLHVTDLHARRSWFDWVAEHADEHDLVIMTGDLLDMFSGEGVGTQVRWITAWARSLPRKIIWCPGNHDVEQAEPPVSYGRWMTALPGAKEFSVSGHRELLGFTFVRVGWRQSIPALRGGDIILAHAPPAGSFPATTKIGGVDNGDIDLADAIRSAAASPWLVFSGHVHAPNKWVDRIGRGTFALSCIGVAPVDQQCYFPKVSVLGRRKRRVFFGHFLDRLKEPVVAKRNFSPQQLL